MNDPSSRRYVRMLWGVALTLAIALPPAGLHADTIVTDRAGNRFLAKPDGTYHPIPNAALPGGSAAPGSGSALSGTRPTLPPSSASGPSSTSRSSTASPSARDPAAQALVPGAHYQRYPLDQVRAVAAGTLVLLDGWIGKYDADDQLLMFRDRTVGPPFVLLRLQEAGRGRVGQSVMARCQAACPVRVKGEVLPDRGEAPVILAHALETVR